VTVVVGRDFVDAPRRATSNEGVGASEPVLRELLSEELALDLEDVEDRRPLNAGSGDASLVPPPFSHVRMGNALLTRGRSIGIERRSFPGAAGAGA
jgi:hypothetical protein